MAQQELTSGYSFDGQDFRYILVDGKPWVLAIDVCKCLGLQNPSKAVSRLEADEKLVYQVVISGQNRQALFVNESGLYALIFMSRKKDAVKFRKWVTETVLLQIRQTGSFNTQVQKSIHTLSDTLRVKEAINAAKVPLTHVSVMTIGVRSLYKTEADFNQALDYQGYIEISMGQAVSPFCRDVLKIPESDVITYDHVLQNGRIVPARAYPKEYAYDIQLFIENDYMEKKFEKYADGRRKRLAKQQKQLPAPKQYKQLGP